MKDLDPRDFRNALGQFATGVTVITTRDESGRPVGVTASSFNSVSLDPPLVLWSLDKSSSSLQAFADNGYFAVHILAAGQENISNNFAKRGEDKFANISCDNGENGLPLLQECAACFQCKLSYQYEGGDHIILVGEVIKYDNYDRRPLIFHSGSYARAKPSNNEAATMDSVFDCSGGGFSSDFLGYLISRAHYQLHLPLLKEIASFDMTESQYFILSVLCIKNEMSINDLNAFLAHTGQAITIGDCSELQELGFLSISDNESDIVRITDEGKSRYVSFLAADVAREKDALADFSPEELSEFVGYLKRVIGKTDPGVPDLWG